LIPAVLHFFIASGTASLGGSIREINPRNSKSPSGKGKFNGFFRSNLYPIGY